MEGLAHYTLTGQKCWSNVGCLFSTDGRKVAHGRQYSLKQEMLRTIGSKVNYYINARPTSNLPFVVIAHFTLPLITIIQGRPKSFKKFVVSYNSLKIDVIFGPY